MKTTMYFRLIVFTVVLVILASCSATTPDKKKEQLEKLKKEHAELAKQIKTLEAEVAAANPSEQNLKSKEVSVTTLAPKAFDHYVQTQGMIESENNVMVSAKTMGVITQVFATEGQTVSKGQVIAQIDNSVILRSIESMRSQLNLANTVFERQENLWKQKIGTEVQYLQAKTNKESLEKQLESLQEQANMAKITAPISGTVDEVHVKVGENIAPGMPAARVVNANDLKLVAKISEAYITQVNKNDKVIVKVSELNKEIEGKVSFVGRTIDPMSRTFTIEVNLKSLPELRPNMTATVKVVFNSVKDALVIPVNVIQNINDEKIVYIAETEGKNTVAKRKVITVDGVYNGQAQVNGLSSGDKVITFGYQGLNDGELIKI